MECDYLRESNHYIKKILQNAHSINIIEQLLTRIRHSKSHQTIKFPKPSWPLDLIKTLISTTDWGRIFLGLVNLLKYVFNFSRSFGLSNIQYPYTVSTVFLKFLEFWVESVQIFGLYFLFENLRYNLGVIHKPREQLRGRGLAKWLFIT